jgi:hypothetical protein
LIKEVGKMNLTDFILRLEQWGVANVLLPFILVFTIVFAIMQKTEILGKDKKNINVMIALVMGLAIIFPHVLGIYPPESDPVNIINRALPNVSVIFVAIVMLLLLIGLLGGEIKWLGTSISGWIAVASFLVIIYIFGRAAGWFGGRLPNWLVWLENPDTQAFIVILLVFGIIVWFITKDEKASKGNVFNNTMESIGQLFKK